MSSNEDTSLILTQSDEVALKPNEVASLILTQSVKDLILNFQLSFYCKNTSVVFQLSVTRLEQLSFYCKNTSAVRDEVGAAVLLLQEHVKDVILNFQLSFYCNDTSAMKKSSRERLQKMVQSCKELFSL